MLQTPAGSGVLINALAVDTFRGGYSAGEKVEFLILDVTTTGVAVVKVWGRAKGSALAGTRANAATTDYTATLAIVNLTSGATIAGGTGIAATGVYQIETTGLEYGIEYDYTSGTGSTVYASVSTTTR